MNADEALKIVYHESFDLDGIVTETRGGKLPAPERMKALHDALTVMFHHLQSSDTLDRRLANALFGLSFHVESNVANLHRHTQSVPQDFFDNSLMPLLLLIESIFENEWMLD